MSEDTTYSPLEFQGKGGLFNGRLGFFIKILTVICFLGLLGFVANAIWYDATIKQGIKEQNARLNRLDKMIVSLFESGTCPNSRKRQDGTCGVPTPFDKVCDCVNDSTNALYSNLQGNFDDVCGCTNDSTNALYSKLQLNFNGVCDCANATSNILYSKLQGNFNNLYTNLFISINNLLASYFGINCYVIRNSDIPINLNSNMCYIVGENLVINTSITAISAINQGNIDLTFANHYALTLADARVVLMRNTTKMNVRGATCRSPTQRLGSLSRCVQADTSSRQITIDGTYCQNMLNCDLNFASDVTITHHTSFGLLPGNGTSPTSYGVFCNDAINCEPSKVYHSMPYALPANSKDGFSIGIYSSRDVSFDSSENSANIQDVYIDGAAIGLDMHRGRSLILKNVRIHADPNAYFGNGAQITGSSGSFDSVTASNIVINMVGRMVGGDGLLLWNARSIELTDVSVYGGLQAVPGGYRGSLFSIGIMNSPLFNAGNNKFRVQPARIKDITVRTDYNDVVCVAFNAGLQGSNFTATIDGATISGGLAGILLGNNTRAVVLNNVVVADSTYGYAAVDHARTIEMENCKALNCCVGYYADNTTHGIGLYNNKAITCGTGYQNQGTNNEFGVGMLTEGNNKELDSTAVQCSPAGPLIFNPFVSSLENSGLSDDIITALKRKYGIDDIHPRLDIL